MIGTTGANIAAFGVGTSDLVGQSNLGLGPLALNGGTTATHALVDGNMAVDRVTGVITIGVDESVDQRGIARPQGAAKDAGAYEATGVLAALCDNKLVTISLATNGGDGDGTGDDDVILGTGGPRHHPGRIRQRHHLRRRRTRHRSRDLVMTRSSAKQAPTPSGAGAVPTPSTEAAPTTPFSAKAAGNTGPDAAQASTCETTPGVETLF